MGDIIIINNVTLANYTQISSEREKRGLKFRLSLYMVDPGRLIVTIPTEVHEVLHRFLNDSISSITIYGMGMPRWQLRSVGSATHTNLDDAGGVRSWGEGDSCLKPHVRPPNCFPTVVIEVSYSQTWPSLRAKARWWFTASHFDVKIVILAKSDHHNGIIIIEKWRAVEAALQPGVRTQAQANAPAWQPACDQRIHITRIGNGNPTDPASYHVTDPLCLKFEDVFLRQPVGQLEGDIVIDIAELQAYAVTFWLANVNE